MSNEPKNHSRPLSFQEIGALADAFEKSPITIQRWVEGKDDLLTTEKAKKVFSGFGLVWDQDTGMVNEILEESETAVQ